MTRENSLACGLAISAFIFAPASDAQLTRQPNTTLTLPAALPSATGYTLENAMGNHLFTLPICTAVAPGDANRLFVAERDGTIQAMTNLHLVDDGNSSTNPTKTAFFSLSSLLPAGQSLRTDGENGFLSLAFHPNFASNGTFFVYFSMQVNSGSVLHQRLHKVVVTTPSANTATLASHTPVLTILDRATNHNGGDIHFGADGYLYLSLGDEGGAGDNHNNGRFITSRNDATARRTGFWGQLIRIDVDNLPQNLDPPPHSQNSAAFPSAVQAGAYKVPADNPFIGYTRWHYNKNSPQASMPAAFPPEETLRTEIWATGLRNPFRWSFDVPTGRLFLADVGQNIWEEINIVHKGDDLGWSWREGANVLIGPPSPTTIPPPADPGDPPGTGYNPVDPIYQYDHTNDGAGSGNDGVVWGSSITGGVVYRGNRLPELYGAYLFSDYNSGFLVALRENGSTWTGTRLLTDNRMVHFGIDPRNNDVILCDIENSRIYRIVRTGTSGAQPPALLSQTGAFSSLAALTPQAGVVPFEPNVSFWSDYAHKSRWFCIKNVTDTVTFSRDANWAFPTGMIWIKHFDFDVTRGNPATRRKLETRFLVKTANEVYGLSYRWRADQTDADLVAEDGFTEVISGSSPSQTWRYPSRTECIICHSAAGGHALSFNTRQLNLAHDYGIGPENQIGALRDAGYFAASPVVDNPDTMPAFAPATDTTQSLEWRVRSYLAVNCLQCHQPGGAAQGLWDARATTPLDLANIINGSLVNTAGDPLNRFAAPGDTAHSMVLRRLQGNGVPRMPPLATSERNLEAEQLITDWIDGELDDRLSFAQWQALHFGSSANPDADPDADPDKDDRKNRLEFLVNTDPLDGTDGWQWGAMSAGPAGIEFQFQHPANRSCLIETSINLVDWTHWDAAGNSVFYPAQATQRSIVVPPGESQRHFRARFGDH